MAHERTEDIVAYDTTASCRIPNGIEALQVYRIVAQSICHDLVEVLKVEER